MTGEFNFSTLTELRTFLWVQRVSVCVCFNRVSYSFSLRRSGFLLIIGAQEAANKASSIAISAQHLLPAPAKPTGFTGFKLSIEDINRVHPTTFALRAENCAISITVCANHAIGFCISVIMGRLCDERERFDRRAALEHRIDLLVLWISRTSRIDTNVWMCCSSKRC